MFRRMYVLAVALALSTGQETQARGHGFLENKGQYPVDVRFVGSADGSFVIVEANRITLQLVRVEPGPPVPGLPEHLAERLATPSVRRHNVTLELPSDRWDAIALEPTTHLRHYLRGDDGARSAIGVREFRALRLVNRDTGAALTLDIAGGTQPLRLESLAGDGIQFTVRGHTRSLQRATDRVELATPLGGLELRGTADASDLDSPMASWATSNPADGLVASWPPTASGTTSITLGYTTFLGGGAFDDASGVGYRPGGAENTESYICGQSLSVDLPATPGVVQPDNGGMTDAFVSRQRTAQAQGGPMTWTTYLGGTEDDRALDLSVHPNGSVAVVGQTASDDFPTAMVAHSKFSFGGVDAFVSRVSSDGTSLVGSTYLGGANDDWALGVVSTSEGTHVTGGTLSADFGLVNPAPMNGSLLGLSDGFIASLDPTLVSLTSSTFITGTNCDAGEDIALGSDGLLHVAGTADSVAIAGTGLPGFDPNAAGGNDNGFVVAFSPSYLPNLTPGAYVHRTFIEGSRPDGAHGIAVDSRGDVYVSGYARSNTTTDGFPSSANAYDATHNGGRDAYLARLDFNSLKSITYLGGNRDEVAWKIAVPEPGVAVVTGHTGSTDFPTAGAFQTTLAGATDVFVTRIALLENDVSHLEVSSFLGGGRADVGYAVAVSADGGTAHVAGLTHSPDFPTSVLSADPTFNGSGDAFLARLTLP